jgi:hypothetical protein
LSFSSVVCALDLSDYGLLFLSSLLLSFPFFFWISPSRRGLNKINFSSITGGRSRSRSTLCIGIIRFGTGVTRRENLGLNVEGTNHTINNMI